MEINEFYTERYSYLVVVVVFKQTVQRMTTRCQHDVYVLLVVLYYCGADHMEYIFDISNQTKYVYTKNSHLTHCFSSIH